MYILLKSGRRYPYAISMLSCGIILLAIMSLPKDNPDPIWGWAVVVISTLGKAFVTFSFGAVYLYTAELYPTVLRSTGMGTSSFMARQVFLLQQCFIKLCSPRFNIDGCIVSRQQETFIDGTGTDALKLCNKRHINNIEGKVYLRPP